MTARFPFLRLPAPRAAFMLALVLPVFAWAPLTYPGYFELHSGFLPVFNLNDLFARGLDLSWSPHIGQSFDLLRGEGTLPYWLAAIVSLLGFPPVGAVKVVFGLSLVSASLGMFAWIRRRLGAWPALVGAGVYTLSPVVLATVYVRGAFAEAVFLGIAPWVLNAAGLAGSGRRAGALGLALSLAAAFLTQPGLGLWLAAITLLYLLLRSHRSNQSGMLGWAAGVALGLAWLTPALLRSGWGGTPSVSLTAHLVYPHQFLGAWGSGPSVPEAYDTLTFSLGLMGYGLAIIGLVLGRASGSEPANTTSSAAGPAISHVFPLVVFAALLFLTSTLAGPIWRLAPFLGAPLTYPWQLLLLAIPWLAWLAAAGGEQLFALGTERAPSNTLPLAAAVLALVLLPSYSDLRPTMTSVEIGSRPQAIYGENEIALLSAAPDGVPRPGGEVTLEVRWQALHTLDRDYTVFFHVMGPDGQRHAQQDTVPGGGSLPTSGWAPGEIVTDRYTVTIPASARSGPYQFWLGLYDPQGGERLSTGSDDKFVLPVAGAGN